MKLNSPLSLPKDGEWWQFFECANKHDCHPIEGSLIDVIEIGSSKPIQFHRDVGDVLDSRTPYLRERSICGCFRQVKECTE